MVSLCDKALYAVNGDVAFSASESVPEGVGFHVLLFSLIVLNFRYSLNAHPKTMTVVI